MRCQVFGCIFGVLDPVITIAAAWAGKSPFQAPFGRTGDADKAKRSDIIAPRPLSSPLLPASPEHHKPSADLLRMRCFGCLGQLRCAGHSLGGPTPTTLRWWRPSMAGWAAGPAGARVGRAAGGGAGWSQVCGPKRQPET